MPIRDPQQVSALTMLILTCMTLLGSLASYAYQIINGRKFHFITLIAQMIISVFSGAMMYMLLTSHYNITAELAGGICGFAGWSGGGLMKAIEHIVIKQIRNRGND